ncbi:MAG: VWA domain-containing protein [Deltaproteobacteria bacterium]|jgi:hypothetical protein|nr:VWA domain-containing protein [Deltaproteobacteria bacterium]
MKFARYSFILLMIVLMVILADATVQAQNTEAGTINGTTPLPVPGKKTIFRRVVVHPQASWYNQPDGQAVESITPFSVLYIYYEIKNANGHWLRCATNTIGQNIGWVNGSQTSEWNQALVLLFAERAKRKPLVFFKSYDDLLAVANEADIDYALTELKERFERYFKNGQLPPDDFPVVSVEPDNAEGAISDERFYLMPIFRFDDTTFLGVKVLEVGSIDPGSEPTTEVAAKNANSNDSNLTANNTGTSVSGSSQPKNTNYGQLKLGSPVESKKPKFGVAIVIDTTISMQPFITECRNFAQELYDRIEKSKLDNVYLGLVSYRNSVKARPGVEYVSKVISDLEPATNRQRFIESLSELKEAKVSTHSFSEDSLAGLETAVSKLSWGNDFIAKYIILITDAGPLPIADPFNTTLHSPSSIAGILKSEDFNLIVFHIKSTTGIKNHAMATDAYTQITAVTNPGLSLDTYYGVRTDDYIAGGSGFARSAGEIGDFLVDAILEGERRLNNRPAMTISEQAFEDAVTHGKDSSVVATEIASTFQDLGNRAFPNQVNGGVRISGIPVDSKGFNLYQNAETHREPTGNELVDGFTAKGAQIGSALGYSVLLKYLGTVNQTRAPNVVRSWIADKDMSLLAQQDGEEVETVQVAVLLTKNQLNALATQLDIILSKANEALNTQSGDFFQSILSASAQISNDPAQFALKNETKLSELGLMSEFLDDLPYKSVIMGLTEKNWYEMSQFQQDEFIRTIKSRLKVYEKYNQDINHWAQFSGPGNEGDWLYRVPLSMLP